MLSQNSLEMFPHGIKGFVLEPIALFQFGRVNCRGSWRARLHQISCQTTLLPGQPILAIGREGNSLIVIPVRSIVWELYLDDFAQFLTPTEIDEIQRYDSGRENGDDQVESLGKIDLVTQSNLSQELCTKRISIKEMNRF